MDVLKIKNDTFVNIIDWGMNNSKLVLEKNSFNENTLLPFNELEVILMDENDDLKFIIKGNSFNDMKIITNKTNDKNDLIQIYGMTLGFDANNNNKILIVPFTVNDIDVNFLEQTKKDGIFSIIEAVIYLYLYILFHENVVEVERTVKRHDTHKPKKSKKKRKIYLEKQYKIKYIDTEAYIPPKREIVRTAESWNVRGHFRCLKSGKKVFVKPYVKGKGKKVDKEYVL